MAKPKPPQPTKAIRKALDEALDLMGGIVKAAATLKVTLSGIQQWRTRGIPSERACQLEKLTGVLKSRLRPDLYA